MQITIDTDLRTMLVEGPQGSRRVELYSPEAFEEVSRIWLKVGWSLRYSYSFTWLGRPVIQLPEDLIRIQELIFSVQPHVIVETGVAHGGSLVFYASLLKLMGRGQVIGVDIEIRPHNRKAIEKHALSDLITLIEGDSAAPTTIARVRECVAPTDRVLVLLDSNHTRSHVLAELEAYAPLIAPGSYVIVADGIMADLADVPGGSTEWRMDNPATAIAQFAESHPEFLIEEPPFMFNEGRVRERVTYWPAAFLRRRGA